MKPKRTWKTSRERGKRRLENGDPIKITESKNWKTKVVKDLPQAYMISLFCLTPLSFLQGRYVAGNYRKWTSWIQGSTLFSSGDNR